MENGPTGLLLSCIKDQQFNTEKKENMNVFVSNLKDKIARVFDGKFWTIRDGEDVIESLLQKYKDW